MSGHPFFDALDDYETALLLTTLTMGGSEKAELFAYLEAETRGRVQERGQALVAIPTEARVALMVRELKERLSPTDPGGLERVDVTWLLEALRGESPRLVGLLLMGLPPPLTRTLLGRLPPKIREGLPPKQQLRAVSLPIAELVRRLIGQRLAPMPPPPGRDTLWTLRELVLLSRKELRVICRDLGLIELGQAFVAVGRMALVELCRRLPQEYEEELVEAVQVAAKMVPPDPKHAQRFLSRVVVNFEDTEELFQKAGLWRLAKAILTRPPSEKRAIAQRLPRRAGLLLLEYGERVEEVAEQTVEQTTLLADATLVRVVVLSRVGRLRPDWGEAKVEFSDNAAAQSGLLLATEILKDKRSRDPGEGPPDE